MKKRHSIKKSAKTRRKFNKGVHKTKKVNLAPNPMRGGYRL